MKKQYQYKNISYGFSLKFRKWLFTNNKGYTVYLSVNGKEMAHKVSHLVNAGLIRTNSQGLDNLARTNINSLVSQ